jgi:hypothetical protein
VSTGRRDDNNLKTAYLVHVTSFIFRCELAFHKARGRERAGEEGNVEVAPGGRVQGAAKLVAK